MKVTARIASGGMPQAAISQAMRCVSTRVLPLPAPASTSSGPSVVSTARRCSGSSPARSDAAISETLVTCTHSHPGSRQGNERGARSYSTVTLFARLRGWSTSVPLSTAT